MELLQDNFALLGERFDAYRDWLQSVGAEVASARTGRDADWLQTAEQVTAQMAAQTHQAPSADTVDKPQPEPAMRIGPRV